jgi:predicted amidohydrolase
MQDLKIVIIQSDLIWENAYQNLKNFDQKLDIVSTNPDLIILPEMFSTGFTMNKEFAETMNGKTINWLKSQAIKNNCVIAGSVLMVENEKYFNRFIWMNPDGTYEQYDKRHLFRMGKEHQTITGGTNKKIVEHRNWKINLQVCYDLRFPVWSKNNYMNGKYDFDALLYIANWPEVRNQAYKSLLVARAIENQSYVIWANRVGCDNNKINHTGDSMVIDPFGKIIARASAGKVEILHAVLVRKSLDDFRENFKVGLDWDNYTVHD